MDEPTRQGREKLYVYNGGFLTKARIRRILELAGWDVHVGKPGHGDKIGVWGQSPTSGRGEWVAERTDAEMVRVEDSFLRSVLPGRSGSDPLGLNIDSRGVHFDPNKMSDLEHILTREPLDDTGLLNRARAAAARLKYLHLSKYNAFHLDVEPPEAPYVLVIDQTLDDASVSASGASKATFQEMLVFAQTEHPGNRIIVKTHPESQQGHRQGHFDPDNLGPRTNLCDDTISPWTLMEGATAVYTVSSQLGFEAIYAGHRPRVFGQPFYAGWGLTEDEYPVPRRTRKLTRAQLFAASMILYPTWYDPYRDQLCELEDVMDALAADARAWRDDHQGWSMSGMSPWKRAHLNAFYGRWKKPVFSQDTERSNVTWASSAESAGTRMEDGFIRSRGLGAKLIPPVSLVLDHTGIYYDPKAPSDLENLIAASPRLPEFEKERAENVISRITASGISKYNLQDDMPDIAASQGRRKILVPGQVEDDASVRFGCPSEASNIDLLHRTRLENPDAFILYKPHPDVVAGLRPGKLDPAEAAASADQIVENANISMLIDWSDEVWTLTSLTGFEALLRRKEVACLGHPFYAGWGLTRDLNGALLRRQTRPTLAELAHATLIGYPRYHDPISDLPCSLEVILDQLEQGALKNTPSRVSRLQSLFAGLLPFVRRFR